MPLELKTGRASGSAEHKGQVTVFPPYFFRIVLIIITSVSQLILYSMMMSERRPDPESGLLLYLRNSSVQEVKCCHFPLFFKKIYII